MFVFGHYVNGHFRNLNWRYLHFKILKLQLIMFVRKTHECFFGFSSGLRINATKPRLSGSCRSWESWDRETQATMVEAGPMDSYGFDESKTLAEEKKHDEHAGIVTMSNS